MSGGAEYLQIEQTRPHTLAISRQKQRRNLFAGFLRFYRYDCVLIFTRSVIIFTRVSCHGDIL